MTVWDRSQLTIRPYRPGDEPGVLELWRKVFPVGAPHNEPPAELHRKLAADPEMLFVATVDRRIVGTVMADYAGHRGWIYMVGVDPELRRRGIGEALVRRVEERLRAGGAPKINLQVRGDNSGVVAFYEKLGYGVEDRISMGKKLYEQGAGSGDPGGDVPECEREQ